MAASSSKLAMVEKEVAPSLYAAEVVAKGPAALLRSQVPKAVQVGAFYSQLGHLCKHDVHDCMRVTIRASV